MRKSTALLLLCALLLAALTGCGLDLSHKHYLDDFGVCRGCGEELAVSLSEGSDGVLFAGVTDVPPSGREGNYAYFKFTSRGEAGILITASAVTDTTAVSEVSLYREGAYGLALIPKGDGAYLHEGVLTAGEVYYVRVASRTGGQVTLSVAPQ